MSKWFERELGSRRFWIFVGVCAFFGYAVYYTVNGVGFSFELLFDVHGVYHQVSRDPWWWMVLYYGSEGVLGSVALVFRVIAGGFALYSALMYWRRKDRVFSKIKGTVGKALLFEAGHFLAMFLSVIASFVYFFSTESLYYFDHTPSALYLSVGGLPVLAMIVFVSPLLLKLRATIVTGASEREIIKWICLTGISYIFVVFWFNYSLAWAASILVPYEPLQHGVSFLMDPPNLISFILTVGGLFALAVFGVISTLPAIRKQSIKLNRRHLGLILMALGGYFIFHVIYYYLTGGYRAHPSVWYEVIGPLHNAYLWCTSFTFLGLAVIVRRDTVEKPE